MESVGLVFLRNYEVTIASCVTGARHINSVNSINSICYAALFDLVKVEEGVHRNFAPNFNSDNHNLGNGKDSVYVVRITGFHFNNLKVNFQVRYNSRNTLQVVVINSSVNVIDSVGFCIVDATKNDVDCYENRLQNSH